MTTLNRKMVPKRSISLLQAILLIQNRSLSRKLPKTWISPIGFGSGLFESGESSEILSP